MLCKGSNYKHLEYIAPADSVLKKWATFDVALLVEAGLSSEHVTNFKSSILDGVCEEALQCDTKVYDGVKALVSQVGAGAWGGIGANVVGPLLDRLPSDGPLNDVLQTFFSVAHYVSYHSKAHNTVLVPLIDPAHEREHLLIRYPHV